MAFDDIHAVHLIGAGGIGISAIGKFLQALGKRVSGSDAKASPITDDLVRRGVAISIGHAAENVPLDCDLVVYTEAAPETNPERVEAMERGVRSLGHFDFLGELSKSYRTICVTGTNGKSTTTAMLGRIFESAQLDPTVFVGSLVPGWELGNLRIGNSDILIIEGDEYKQKMVKLWPEVTVITNIEEDHLDVYRDLDHIVATFQELVTKTTGDVFVNADDANSARLTGERLSTYSHHDVDDVMLGVPGEFNRANAAAARAAAKVFGIPDEVIASSLASYSGIWRRFERVGKFNGADVISDYAHHPTAIKGTIAAAKEFFPERRIVVLFEPHQHSRTKELFDDFVSSFALADVVIISEIYGVVGRADAASSISSRDLVDAMHHPNKSYAANLDDAEAQLREIVQPKDVVIVMGAGDVDRVARSLVA